MPFTLLMEVIAVTRFPSGKDRWIGHSVKVQNDNDAQVDDHHFDQFNSQAREQQIQDNIEAEIGEKCGTPRGTECRRTDRNDRERFRENCGQNERISR